MSGSRPPVVVRPPEARLPRRLDRYELIGELARGGMGTVLLARLAGAGGFARLFAIKLLHPHLAADEQFVHMLLDEARLASRIHHSNAVPIVDVCQSELGLYVVMDYIEGFTFNKILNASALGHDDRVRIGVQALLGVLAGLEAAHNLTDEDGTPFGLVHRDVSPSNVLVGLDGVGRIADFGIAHSGARITHTEPGLVKGKAAYMAPEQARGAVLDRRADVWGVGVMLWECLTGKKLFKSETDAATVLRVMKEPIPPPSKEQARSPITLDPVCKKALDRDVSKRYASAHEMAAELLRAAERAGCLATSIEAADLLRSRFGEEIAGRQQAIRAHCANLRSSGAGDTPSRPSHRLPAAQRLRAVPPAPPGSTPPARARATAPATDALASPRPPVLTVPEPPPLLLTGGRPASGAPPLAAPPAESQTSSSLLLEITVDPPKQHGLLRGRRALIVATGVLVALAIVLLLARARTTPASAPIGTPLPPPTKGTRQVGAGGTAAPLPANSPTASSNAPTNGNPPAGGELPGSTLLKSDKHHAHSSHAHGSHAAPALEMNPYLHR
jgi:eukaryotic-like serine/threonine-protein kinase